MFDRMVDQALKVPGAVGDLLEPSADREMYSAGISLDRLSLASSKEHSVVKYVGPRIRVERHH